MLTLLELDVEEAIRCLAALVNFDHLSIAGEDFFAIYEKSDCDFLAQLHSLSDDLMELEGLEVTRNQKSIAQTLQSILQNLYRHSKMCQSSSYLFLSRVRPEPGAGSQITGILSGYCLRIDSAYCFRSSEMHQETQLAKT